ncbi:hypothetical protein BE08_26610 [Sorangium cellulosum]|uniref:Uncharacterized protein n=1 Tax=Sorangium cellulosum TaxID=56 RepID=A0A150NZD6_SORCE|nr:hypothetical protein BE08_26610 [Sorangium cellulosum]
MLATNLDQVITQLQNVTDLAEREASKLGYFAALYTRVTLAVTERIRAGFFEDGPQMERLDVAFANLYLDAIGRRLRGAEGVRTAWRLAFDAAEEPDASVLQHIYLGMNAHLLFDLPIAVAMTCPPQRLSSLRIDFLRMNEVVDAEMGAFHDDLCRISSSLARFQRSMGWLWVASSSATMRVSRRFAWRRAARLTGRGEREQALLIDSFDQVAGRIGAEIIRPRVGVRSLFRAVRAGENEDVREVIRMLRPRHR